MESEASDEVSLSDDEVLKMKKATPTKDMQANLKVKSKVSEN